MVEIDGGEFGLIESAIRVERCVRRVAIQAGDVIVKLYSGAVILYRPPADTNEAILSPAAAALT